MWLATCVGLTRARQRVRGVVAAGAVLVLLASQALPLSPPAHAQSVNTDSAALTRAVQRLVDANSDADACRPIDPAGGEQRFECVVTECPGACQVVHVVTVLGLRRGRFRRVSQERVHRGDTGACGCCMADF